MTPQEYRLLESIWRTLQGIEGELSTISDRLAQGEVELGSLSIGVRDAGESITSGLQVVAASVVSD